MIYQKREYQEKAVEVGLSVLRDNRPRREIMVLPTAAGKAIIIARIAKEIKDGKILVLQPNVELLEQGIQKLNDIEATYSVFSASVKRRETEENLIYATPKSITYEDFKDLGIKYVIVDECDFSSKPDSDMIHLLKKLNIKSCLGLTATPFYLENTFDGSLTRMMYQVKGSYFTDICFVTQIQELVDGGYWSDFQYYDNFDRSKKDILKINKNKSDYSLESQKSFYELAQLKEKTVDLLKRLPDGENALVFVPSVDEAEELQKLLPNSVTIHSKVSPKERKKRVENFKNNTNPIAITVIALTVGFDKPDLINIVDCSPTKSIRLYMQKTGRLVRPYNSKKGRYIDFSGSYYNHGDVRQYNFENIKGYGWGLFKNDTLVTDVPMTSKHVFTKDYLRGGGKINIQYVFGNHNKGDAVFDFGQNKGKTVKYLYYRKRHYLRWLAESDFQFKDKELERQVKLIFNEL